MNRNPSIQARIALVCQIVEITFLGRNVGNIPHEHGYRIAMHIEG